MRYGGNFISNISEAHKAKDLRLLTDIIVDKMAVIINDSPGDMLNLLEKSNIAIQRNSSINDLVKTSVKALHNSPDFRDNLTYFLIENKDRFNDEYSFAEGSGDGGGGDAAASIVSSIAEMVGSIGKWGASKNELKSQEERSKSKLFDKILNSEKKTNWMPIVAISGILLIGALVVWRVTGTK